MDESLTNSPVEEDAFNVYILADHKLKINDYGLIGRFKL